jgi:hypothetical protein
MDSKGIMATEKGPPDAANWTPPGGKDRLSQTITTTAGDSLLLSFTYSARPGVSAQSIDLR